MRKIKRKRGNKMMRKISETEKEIITTLLVNAEHLKLLTMNNEDESAYWKSEIWNLRRKVMGIATRYLADDDIYMACQEAFHKVQ